MFKVQFSTCWCIDLPDELRDLYEAQAIDDKDSVYNNCKYYEPDKDKPHTGSWADFVGTDAFKDWSSDKKLFGFFNADITEQDLITYMFVAQEKMRVLGSKTIELNVAIEDFSTELIKQNLELMQKQYEQLKEFSIGVEQLAFNQKSNAPVSDTFLHSADTILLLEDCCSDELQRALNAGWRIISVTPQPNQRRPDYILGKATGDKPNSALRYI